MLKPDYERWERGLLQALSRTYQFQDVLTLVVSMLKEHPDDAGLWLFSAKAALQAGEIDQGMNRLEQAGEWTALERMLGSARDQWGGLDNLQRSKVLMREAEISLHKGDKSTAGDALEKAITLDPSNADALISLADIHRKKGDSGRAELLYQRAGAYGAYREKSMISMAQLAMDQDDFEGALRILQAVSKEFPNRTDLNRNIESLENIVLLENDN